MVIKELFYMPWWYLNNVLLGRKHPLQTVLFITDHCNLRCRHCAPDGHGGTCMKPFGQIKEELQYAYGLGSRFVDFEGGEPTLWRDGKRRLNDLYLLAKEIGFFSCTLTTNGQRPFGDTKADSVWVSVDGYGPVHDQIRGEGAFARLDEAIRTSGHPAVSINMAINRVNRHSVADTVRYAKENPAIRSISLNFHTPFPGTEELMLSWEERCAVIDDIVFLKKQGYPIMNSISGLRAMKRRGVSRPCWISNFILNDGTRLESCPGKPAGICADCGFCMAGEMDSLVRLRPDTVLSGLRLRL